MARRARFNASAILAGAFLFGAPLGAAEAPVLHLPMDCTLGEDCFIQQYPDRDPGPGSTDFTCGPMSYDGHKGTDFRLSDDAAMAAGVAVLAAAPGVVVAIRDGEADVRQTAASAPNVEGRECGNGVLVRDQNGWEMQYCHLRRDSVRVRPGQAVETGAILGQVGLSGRTDFPHLHLTVRNPAGTVIDPFDARQQNALCTFRDTRTLWADSARVGYVPGGALDAGFLDRVPDYEEVRAGLPPSPTMAADAPALVLWAHFYGPRRGDTIRLSLTGPDGAVVATGDHVMPRTRATQYRAVGRKARGPWPKGVYRGTADLIRDGSVIDSLSRQIEMR